GSLLSFNHKKGIWEDVGGMTVSTDGKFFCTDPGVGILQPGWHGAQAPKPAEPPPPAPKRKCHRCDDCFEGCVQIWLDDLEGCKGGNNGLLYHATSEGCDSISDATERRHCQAVVDEIFKIIGLQCALAFHRCQLDCDSCYNGDSGGANSASAIKTTQTL